MTEPARAPDSTQTATGGLSFEDIRALILSFPNPCGPACPSEEKDAEFQKNLYYVNNNQLQHWIKARVQKPIARPRLCLFGAHHGASTTQARTENEKQFQEILANNTPLTPMLSDVNADLKLYELDFKTPTRAQAPAMTDDEAMRAMAYGMMAIEQGTDLIGLCAIGGGSADASRKLMAALQTTDPYLALITHGGFDHAALIGACIATKLGNVPTLLSGPAAQAAQLFLHTLNPGATVHALDCGHPLDGFDPPTHLGFMLGVTKLLGQNHP